MSSKFTLSYSNTPGPLKPFFFIDKDGKKIQTIQSSVYAVVGGKMAFNVSLMSFSGGLKMTCSSDANVFSDNKKLCKYFEEHLINEISINGCNHDVYKVEDKFD